MNDERAGTPVVDDDPADRPQSDPPSAATASDSDPRTTVAGRYRIDLQAPPTDAGIAVAYAGRDLRTRDPVWVKTLRVEYRADSAMRARFRREARLLQFLSHPNVIRALTFTEERGAPWLVLERPTGRSLREVLTAEGPCSPESVVPVLDGIGAALDHLHARGLVHLELRPESVVIGPAGEVKLVDFGVAQTAGTLAEAEPAPLAETAYLAPEQTCGEPLTVAADVYALGCVVYELLTGEPPFGAATSPSERNAVIRARLDSDPRPPTATNPGLPAWVDDVVLGALQRDPRQRYGSTGSFAAVFRSGVEGDIDVETGRPRSRLEPVRVRQIPVNEPGIAVKGSTRLAARRAEPEPAAAQEAAVIDASFFDPASSRPILDDREIRPHRIDLPLLGRWLWRAVIVAAVMNVLLILALVLTRGELPGIWQRGGEIGPGAVVRIAGTGLVARESPQVAAPIVANLPDGGEVRITGDPVPGDGGPWWPVAVETPAGPVSGYVPESWVHLP